MGLAVLRTAVQVVASACGGGAEGLGETGSLCRGSLLPVQECVAEAVERLAWGGARRHLQSHLDLLTHLVGAPQQALPEGPEAQHALAAFEEATQKLVRLLRLLDVRPAQTLLPLSQAAQEGAAEGAVQWEPLNKALEAFLEASAEERGVSVAFSVLESASFSAGKDRVGGVLGPLGFSLASEKHRAACESSGRAEAELFLKGGCGWTPIEEELRL